MYELIHANCIDVLRTMPDKSVECIVADMPYGVGIDFGEYRDDVENLEALIDVALPEMRRVANRTVLISGVHSLSLYPQPTWTLAWFHNNSARTPWGINHWQPILVYGADPDCRLRMRRPDTMHAYTLRKEPNDHPCPKPLGFMRKLINRVAPSPTDTILDPFMGSGTTGVAAIQLGHKFVGIELNGDYLAIAKRRIAEARPDFTQTIELIINKGTINNVQRA